MCLYIYPTQNNTAKLWAIFVTAIKPYSISSCTRILNTKIVSSHRFRDLFWLSHRIFESACLIDLTHYPFDTHTCKMWFQSLVHNSDELALNIYLPGFDLETQLPGFGDSDEWEILSNTSSVILRSKDEAEALVFSQRRSLRLGLVVSRRCGLISYMMKLPCVVLSAMNWLVFLFPHHRPDRHVIGNLTMFIRSRSCPPNV